MSSRLQPVGLYNHPTPSDSLADGRGGQAYVHKISCLKVGQCMLANRPPMKAEPGP